MRNCHSIIRLRIVNKAISYTVGFRQSKTAVFDWTFLRLDSSGPSSYHQLSRFYSFCALPGGCWCREYCCTAVWQSKIGWPREHCVLRARRTLVQAGWWRWTLAENRRSYVALHSAESRQNYSKRNRCW